MKIINSQHVSLNKNLICVLLKSCCRFADVLNSIAGVKIESPTFEAFIHRDLAIAAPDKEYKRVPSSTEL